MQKQYTELKGREGVSQAISSRIRRGIALHAERASEITYLGAGKYRVPSSRGRGSYVTDIEEQTCTCADRQGHRLGVCKHTIAAEISEAKRPVLSVQKRHNSILMDYEYFLVERRGVSARALDIFPDVGSAYRAKWTMESGEVAA